MDILTAKQTVIEAGKLLVKEGLIQRTWGNVSCRVSDTQFVITPSGMDYLSLTPEKIVLVNVADCSFEGDIKPSSEKGIHAECYKLRPEVNFVIHTHQTYASLVGLAGLDINGITGESAEIIGSDVPVAAYGLPGTKTLRKGVVAALKRSTSKAALMIHHGALCVGTDLDDAFKVANELEKVSKQRLLDRYTELTGKVADDFVSIAQYVSGNLMKSASDVTLDAYDSERSFAVFEMRPADGGEPVCINITTGLPVDENAACPSTALLHAKIYQARDDVNAIVHSKKPATLEVSKIGKTIKPFLDDFAQITGITIKNANYDPNNTLKTARQVVKKLNHRDAVLLSHNGAVCVGSSADEANAVKLVTDKECKAFVSAEIFGKSKAYINTAESLLMRVIYKQKYSKKNAK